jgi:hypothetical protein
MKRLITIAFVIALLAAPATAGAQWVRTFSTPFPGFCENKGKVTPNPGPTTY